MSGPTHTRGMATLRGLSRRLHELEVRSPAEPMRWHSVVQNSDWGETEEEAFAAYEAEHGSIGPEDGVILRVIVSPAVS